MLALLNPHDRPAAAIVTVHGEITPVDEELALKAIREMTSNPPGGTRVHFTERVEVSIESPESENASLNVDPQRFEVLKVGGTYSAERGETIATKAVGIVDERPSDWESNVRRILNDAKNQLPRDGLNLICLEVADSPHFSDRAEVERVDEGIIRFLENDSRRISAVITTTTGVIPFDDKTRAFRTSGVARLFENPNPRVRLTKGFELPDFNHQRIVVQATISKKES